MSVRAALGNDDARAYVRAADDTTSNNAGLIPTRQLTEVINPLSTADRPAIDAISRGVLPDAGMSFEIPKLTAAPTVAEEAEAAAIDETGTPSKDSYQQLYAAHAAKTLFAIKMGKAVPSSGDITYGGAGQLVFVLQIKI